MNRDVAPTEQDPGKRRLTPTEPIGWALRHKRESLKLSARTVSLNAGLSESYVGKVESGRIELSFRNFAKICQVLKLNNQEICCLVRQAALTSDDPEAA